MTINKVLCKIQQDLKAPKTSYNEFGSYNYRSQEDILKAVKPMLPEGVTIKCTDDLVNIGAHNYIKATAILSDGSTQEEAVGFAREDLTRKKMNPEQLTGSASSYARKYALGGLFGIDDTKDSDTNEQHTENVKATEEHNKEQEKVFNKISMNILEFENKEEFSTWWKGTKAERGTLTVYLQKKLIEEMNVHAKTFATIPSPSGLEAGGFINRELIKTMPPVIQGSEIDIQRDLDKHND